ncbi:MAG: ribosome biogenesis GTP-binding protein YihA/YsxC [Alphaproteobacteria bacterium]
MADHEAHGGFGLTGAEADAGAAAADARFRRSCTFAAAVGDDAALPAPGLPEVAFAGRSNVGKSSLLNALVGRAALARTSNTPGRTQTINLFDLGGRLMLVDLPGYGHAQASQERQRAWSGLVERYLRGRPNLRLVLLLVDARRGLMDVDRQVMALLDEAAVVYQAVLTKADAVKPGALDRRLAAVAAELGARPAAYPDIVATSARAGTGIARLRATLAPLAAAADMT